MKPKKLELYRQGDVMLIRLDKMPTGAKKDSKHKGDVILAWGESTNHCHRIKEGTASPYQWDGNTLIRVGKDGAALTHEEHSTITLAPGTYQLRHQREYHPEAIRRVVD